jgi:hypothetical protein
MQRYLNHLEDWLNKWRLSISANKCSFNVYNIGKKPKEITNKSFKLYINGEEIPNEENPKYLGMILDKNMNSNKQADLIVNKCNRLINILKCLSFKKWSMNTDQLINLNKTLIRSNMEYGSRLLLMSEYNLTKLNGIQYNVLKIIHKEARRTSNTYLHDLSSIPKVKERLTELSRRYIEKAINNKNPLILKLAEEAINENQNYKSIFNVINQI